MNFLFEVKTRIHFGDGKLSELRNEAAGLGPKRRLLVTDGNMAREGFVDRVKKLVNEAGSEVVLYDGIDKEPEDTHVEEGSKIYKEQGCDGVIALGGGSVLDAGKAIAIMATNGGNICDYAGLNNVPVPKAPLIAIPTTAGTGSEVTRALGMTNTSAMVKFVIVSSTVAPEVAIVDPELTRNLPKTLTAQTGVDAFTHAMESFVSRSVNPISETLALQAMKIIGGNLKRAWTDGGDSEARRQMMLGQLMAALAVMNTGVCLIHGMGRPLGAYFHVPHGLANAMLAPMVMRFSIKGNEARYARIAEVLGEDLGSLSEEEAANAAVTRIENLCRDLEIPAFSSLKIDRDRFESLIPKMSSDCLASGSPANNPIVPDQKEVEALYREFMGV